MPQDELIKKNIIFVAGIHGVGKSTLCKELEKSIPVTHITASSVIKSYVRQEQQNKQVADVKKNQNILIEGLKLLDSTHGMMLLDGHFVLLNKESDLEQIPYETYEQLTPKAIVVIHHNPSVILLRLKARDDKNYDLGLLARMQKLEVECALSTASKLAVPVLSLNLQAESEPLKTLSSFVLKNM